MTTCAELFSESSWSPPAPPPAAAAAGRVPSGCRSEARSAKIRLDPDNVRNGLAQLVLALVELLRELLERQALRRIDGGSLSEAEIERLGNTFLRLSEEIEKLKEYFGFSDEDLNLNLGPLGTLR